MPVTSSMIKQKYFRDGAVKKRNSAVTLILKHFNGFQSVKKMSVLTVLQKWDSGRNTA